MKVQLPFYAILIIAACTLSACEKEGPMERAGKDLDDAVENVGDALGGKQGTAENIGEKIDETIEDLDDTAK